MKGAAAPRLRGESGPARKLFTPDEANSALPDVRRAVATIQDRMKWLASHPPAVSYLVKQLRIPMDAPVSPDYFGSLIEMRSALGEVESIGCHIKDIQTGLVDFPSRLDGRDILLCWRVGEESIEYYHDLDSGYSGRRPIPENAEPGGASEGAPGAAPGDDENEN